MLCKSTAGKITETVVNQYTTNFPRILVNSGNKESIMLNIGA